jgi:hypothetical protein
MTTSASPLIKGKTLEPLLIAVSLANLFFTNMWIQILTLGSGSFAYFRPTPPDWYFLLALVLDILSLAAPLYLALLGVGSSRKISRWIGLFVFLTLSVLAVNAQRDLLLYAITKKYPSWYPIAKAIAWVSLAVLAVCIWRAPRRIFKAWAAVLIILSPLFGVLTVNALWLYRSPVLRAEGAGKAAGMLPHGRNGPRRVIWIILDELDQRLAFEYRPARVQLPELDRLRAGSFVSSVAEAPAAWTLLSMPSLLSGVPVVDVKTSAYDLRFRGPHDRTFQSWRNHDNLFRRARGAGFDTGVSGWYHSYCRVLGQDFSTCFWDGQEGSLAYNAERSLMKQSIGAKMQYLALWQSRFVPLPSWFLAPSEAYTQPRWIEFDREARINSYTSIVENAVQMLRDRRITLAYIHVPIPHPYGFWNPNTQTFSKAHLFNYFDNLELADKTVGDFRKVLEREDAWNQAAVLVTSDHPLRNKLWNPAEIWDAKEDPRVKNTNLKYIPFILKLPNQKQGYVYKRSFNTVVSQALLWEILNGRISTPEQVASWLDQHSS